MLANGTDDEGFRPFQPARILSFVDGVHRTGYVEHERDFLLGSRRRFQIDRNRGKRQSQSSEGEHEKRPFEYAEFRAYAVVSRSVRKLSVPEDAVREKGERPNRGRREYEDETGGRHYTEGSSLTALELATNRRSEMRSAAKNGNCAEE